MIGMSMAVRPPRQLSLLQQALSAIRRNGGTALYVPDNYAGAFVDSTGTQPVTAVNDLVGLLTDRSYGASNLGGELVTNGDFSSNTTTGWADYYTTMSASGGELTVTGGIDAFSQVYQYITVVANKRYEVTVRSKIGTAANVQIAYDIGAGDVVQATVTTSSYTTTRFIVQAVGTTLQLNLRLGNQNGLTGVFDSISVREVLGNHATQGTTAAKPLVTQLANGTKAMDFDASNDSLTIGMVTSGTPWVRTYTTAGTVTTYTSATTTQIVMGQPQLAGRRVVLMVASNAAITGADLTTIERFAVSRGAVL